MANIITFTPSVPAKPEIDYPESDGQPMGETGFHVNVILYLLQALRHFFRQAEKIYVSADMLFYYEEGNPAAFKVPDVFVAKGISRHDRRTYKLWEEQVAPCVVFEITSHSTWLEDLGNKRALYEKLGVREYFLFDPLDEYLSPRLQGFRLAEGHYQSVELSSSGTLYSEELDLMLQPEEAMLRLVNPASGEVVPTLDEAIELALAETQRAKIEAQRAEVEAQRAEDEAQRAEDEAQRAKDEAQRAETEAQRAEDEAQRAEDEAQRAEDEAQRAETEAQRADTAETELARLRRELERLRRQSGEE